MSNILDVLQLANLTVPELREFCEPFASIAEAVAAYTAGTSAAGTSDAAASTSAPAAPTPAATPQPHTDSNPAAPIAAEEQKEYLCAPLPPPRRAPAAKKPPRARRAPAQAAAAAAMPPPRTTRAAMRAQATAPQPPPDAAPAAAAAAPTPARGRKGKAAAAAAAELGPAGPAMVEPTPAMTALRQQAVVRVKRAFQFVTERAPPPCRFTRCACSALDACTMQDRCVRTFMRHAAQCAPRTSIHRVLTSVRCVQRVRCGR